MYDIAAVQALQRATYHMSIRCRPRATQEMASQTAAQHISRTLDLEATGVHAGSAQIRLVVVLHVVVYISCNITPLSKEICLGEYENVL
jgi:hypothetical protein